FGLFVGSFLNVVIYRLPLRLQQEWKNECRVLLEIDAEKAESSAPADIVSSRSQCPHCGHQITAMENIPVISYLFLRGKCSDCGKPISLRYPIVEILTAVLSGLIAAYFGVTAQTGFLLIFTWALIALSFIDFDHHLLPDKLIYPILWLGLLINSQGLLTDFHSSLYGAIAGYMILWTVYQLFKLLTGKEGMGYGDFKLLALIGAWLGWQMLPVTILLASVIGAIVGIAGILVLGRDRQIPIPFGPYLSAAGFVALLEGQSLIETYLGIAGIG
ncbi:MAG: prepilin peptidase, partial [bacterium]